MIDMPQPFTGTPEQAAANRATHDFVDDGRCARCDTKTGFWPCGDIIPRVAVTELEFPDA